MSRGPDAATLLERALLAAADSAGCPVAIVASDWTRWASATFTGARHSLTLTAPASPRLDCWLSLGLRFAKSRASTHKTVAGGMSALGAKRKRPTGKPR